MGGDEFAHDLAKVLAHLMAGGFTSLVVPCELQVICNKREYATCVTKPLLDLQGFRCGRGQPLPRFMLGKDVKALLKEHHLQSQTPKRTLRVLSVMSGAGGDCLAVLALLKRGSKILMVEVCPEKARLLEERFPEAEVICGDINSLNVQRRLWALKGTFDIILMSRLCQPSSTVNAHRKKGDARIVAAR